MKHKTQEKILAVLGSIVLLTALYYFVKAIVFLP